MDGAGGAVELRVAEGEDATVGSHHPVALSIGGGRHADDGLVQMDGPGRAVEIGVAVGEHTAVGRHHPVPAARRRRRHAHDGLVEVRRGQVTEVVEELIVAEPTELPRCAVEVVALSGRARGSVEGDGAEDFVDPATIDTVELDRQRRDVPAAVDHELVDGDVVDRAGSRRTSWDRRRRYPHSHRAHTSAPGRRGPAR